MQNLRPFRILALLLCFMLVLSFAFSALAASDAVISKSVTFRTGPGTKFSAQGTLKRGTAITVLDNTTSKSWWKISVDGKEGYVSKKYVKASASLKAGGNTAVLTTSFLLSGPGSEYDILLTLNAGAPLTILERPSADWLKVSYEGREGYIQASNTGEPAKPAAEAPKEEVLQPNPNDPLASKVAWARSKNSDAIGWIRVPNTNIDLPILYQSNWYYADHDINRKKSLDGVYPYANVLTKNVVLFGHNARKSASAMHHLHHLQEAALNKSKCQSGQCGKALSGSLGSWYKSSSGRIWNISVFGKQRWEVYAMYEVKANEPISTLQNNWNLLSGSGDEAIKNWIDKQLSRSEINFGVSVGPQDQLMTIITCGTNYDSATANSRLFVFLKNVD